MAILELKAERLLLSFNSLIAIAAICGCDVSGQECSSLHRYLSEGPGPVRSQCFSQRRAYQRWPHEDVGQTQLCDTSNDQDWPS